MMICFEKILKKFMSVQAGKSNIYNSVKGKAMNVFIMLNSNNFGNAALLHLAILNNRKN